MKRIIFLVACIIVSMESLKADNIDSVQNNTTIWNAYGMTSGQTSFDFDDGFGVTPLVNYVWSKGYPIGFDIWGLRLGFAKEDIRYEVSAEEYKIPTWSIHSMTVYGKTVLGPVGFNAGLDVGLNMAKRYRIDPDDPANYYSKTKVYFSIAPIAGINIWLINLSVGYEFLPAFSELSGWIFSGGICLPIDI